MKEKEAKDTEGYLGIVENNKGGLDVGKELRDIKNTINQPVTSQEADKNHKLLFHSQLECPYCGDIINIQHNDLTEMVGYEKYFTCLACYKDYVGSVNKDSTISVNKPTDQTEDEVNHPSHYTQGKIEVIDFIKDLNLNFSRGSAIKYTCRAGKKDPKKEIQDLQKAIFFLKYEIKCLEEENDVD